MLKVLQQVATTTLCGAAMLFGAADGAAQDAISLDTPPLDADSAPPPGDSGVSPDALGAAQEAEADTDGVVPAPVPTPVLPTAAVTQAPPAPARITIRAVRFTPSFYLTDLQLQAAIAPYIGSTLPVSGLAVMIQPVNALYADMGISLAEAFVGGVDRQSGIVTIELFEATVGQVSYQSEVLSDAYLAFRMGIAAGDPADNRVIEDRLNRLALTDGLQVGANFQPGQAVGTTDLVVAIEELPNISGRVTADSYGRASTGIPRLTAALSVRSLTGWGDPLNAALTASQGSLAGSLGYSRVIHPDGTRLGAVVDASASRTVTAPEVASRAIGGELSLQHPFVLRQDFRVQGSFAALGFGEWSTIAGAPLVDQIGFGARLGGSMFASGQGWFVSTGQGVNLINWTDDVSGLPGQLHVAATGNIAAAQALGEDFAIAVQGAGQLALSDAPARYTLGVSGPSATRGYAPDLSSGDSGFYLRTQIDRITPILIGTSGISFTPYVFADIGRAYDLTPGGAVAQDLLASAGVGTGFRLGDVVSGDLFFAKPLLDANGFGVAGQYEVRASVTAAF